MKAHVVNITNLKAGNLKAFVSVRVGPLIMHDWRIIQQDGQRAYVSPPQAEYVDAEGRKRFRKVLDCPEDWLAEIRKTVLTEWQASL